MPPIGYIAYIDEAGDDGIKKLKTQTEAGASEWMVISAVVIKLERESEVILWVRDLIKELNQHQITHLHFRNLPEDKKHVPCEFLASLKVRLFSVLSYKRNIEGHVNIRAGRAGVNKTGRFYCWMTRLLLEEVTTFCARRAIDDYGELRTIKLEFSDRGGLRIDDIKSYYEYIRAQTRMKMIYIDRYNLDWSVVDIDEFYVHPNKMRAGLQLADIVASSFYAGLERAADGSTKPHLAKLLLPRMARDHQKRVIGTGVKIMPRWIPGMLPPDQADLIDFYVTK